MLLLCLFVWLCFHAQKGAVVCPGVDLHSRQEGEGEAKGRRGLWGTSCDSTANTSLARFMPVASEIPGDITFS